MRHVYRTKHPFAEIFYINEKETDWKLRFMQWQYLFLPSIRCNIAGRNHVVWFYENSTIHA